MSMQLTIATSLRKKHDLFEKETTAMLQKVQSMITSEGSENALSFRRVNAAHFIYYIKPLMECIG